MFLLGKKYNNNSMPLSTILTRKKLSSRRTSLLGQTLAEILVGTVIMLVITFFTTVSLIQVYKLWEISSTNSELQLTGRGVMDFMTSELRNATRTTGGHTINIAGDRTGITFDIPADTNGDGFIIDVTTGVTEWMGIPIQYQFVPAQNQVNRLEGANTRILAGSVSGIIFDDVSTDPSLHMDEVRISLTVEKVVSMGRRVSMPFVSIVKLRN